MYPEAYMSLELHDAHEFAWLTAPIRYPAAQDLHPRLKRQCTAVACRPPRGLKPPRGVRFPSGPLAARVWMGLWTISMLAQ